MRIFNPLATMGGSSSKRTLLQKHGNLLSENEREAVFSCFVAITSDQEAEGFTKDQLSAYLKTIKITASDELVNSLYNALREHHPSSGRQQVDQVSFVNFVQNVSWSLKGSLDQKIHFFQGMVGRSIQSLETTLLDIIECVLSSPKSSTHLPEINHWSSNPASLRSLVSYLMQSLKQGAECESDSSVLTKEELEGWLVATPLPFQLLQILLSLSFMSQRLSGSDLQLYTGSNECPDQLLLPAKIIHPIVKEKFNSSLLDHATIILINSALPFEYKGRFYPLFSSRHHGESFSTLCKQIMNRGPTLLILKDEEGHVFGGFAESDWKFNPQFSGSNGCFLFSLFPVMGVYTPTGYNDNYMYLQQYAQTLPNGLGMGGQIDYFGLWISSEYGCGHSKARPKCSTFGSPCLSGKEEFQVEVLEAWGVGQPRLPDSDDEATGPSILDKDNTAKAVLEMAGRKQHSDGLREPVEQDDD